VEDSDAADPRDEDWVRELPDVRPVTWLRIPLSDDEALILSDWIYELQNDRAELSDAAVWPALYAIDGAFATSSPLIFAPDYGDRLDAARTRIGMGSGGYEQPGILVELTADQAVVLADWLRHLHVTDESLRRTLQRISTIIETSGIKGMSLPAARQRSFALMGRNEDGIPFEDLPGFSTGCDRTRRLLEG
jgi:hypothetical protein